MSIMLSLPIAAQHGVINIQTNLDSTTILQYAIDTLESYQVGPGIIYTRFDITNSSTTRHCYIYEVDLTNPYNTVEESGALREGLRFIYSERCGKKDNVSRSLF